MSCKCIVEVRLQHDPAHDETLQNLNPPKWCLGRNQNVSIAPWGVLFFCKKYDLWSTSFSRNSLEIIIKCQSIMLYLFYGLNKLFSFSPVKIDLITFQLHYRLTTAILVFFSVVIAARQLVGNPIDCDRIADIPEDVLDTYCWIHLTYTLPHDYGKKVGKDVIAPGVGPSRGKKGEAKVYPFYQWVIFFIKEIRTKFILNIEHKRIKQLESHFHDWESMLTAYDQTNTYTYYPLISILWGTGASLVQKDDEVLRNKVASCWTQLETHWLRNREMASSRSAVNLPMKFSRHHNVSVPNKEYMERERVINTSGIHDKFKNEKV